MSGPPEEPPQAAVPTARVVAAPAEAAPPQAASDPYAAPPAQFFSPAAPPPAYYGPQAAPAAAYPYTYYAQPGYAVASPYGYPGYPGYTPVLQPPTPDHSLSLFAGVMWLLLMLRDLLAVVFLAIFGTFLGFFSIPVGMAVGFLVVFPLISAVGCVVAMYADFSHKQHTLGTIGGAVALAGSVFPGLFGGIGVIGIVFGIIALALHLGARKEFAAPSA